MLPTIGIEMGTRLRPGCIASQTPCRKFAGPASHSAKSGKADVRFGLMSTGIRISGVAASALRRPQGVLESFSKCVHGRLTALTELPRPRLTLENRLDPRTNANEQMMRINMNCIARTLSMTDGGRMSLLNMGKCREGDKRSGRPCSALDFLLLFSPPKRFCVVFRKNK